MHQKYAKFCDKTQDQKLCDVNASKELKRTDKLLKNKTKQQFNL